MTLDQLTRRDARITELEALGRGRRTAAQQDELGRLVASRDSFWRRAPEMFARTLNKARQIEAYARQHNLPLEPFRQAEGQT